MATRVSSGPRIATERVGFSRVGFEVVYCLCGFEFFKTVLRFWTVRAMISKAIFSRKNNTWRLGDLMAISYKKLWKMLIDRDMYKKDLRAAAGLSTNVIAKMSKDQDVSTEALRKICQALNCGINDILEFIPDGSQVTIKNTEEQP